MKKYVLPLLFLCLATGLKAQIYMEPYAGFQLDANNAGTRFKQINSGLQFSFKTNRAHELVFQLQHSWPVAFHSADSAFTATAGLPLYVSASKKIQPSSSSAAVMNRFAVAGAGTANAFYIVLTTGLVYQRIKVSYTYDKANYSILNPDKTQERTRAYFGFGVAYIRQLRKGRFFAALDFNTPPVGPKIKYPSSFKFLAPAALTAGYSITLKNK